MGHWWYGETSLCWRTSVMAFTFNGGQWLRQSYHRSVSGESEYQQVTIGSVNGFGDKSLSEPLIMNKYLWTTLTKAFHTNTIFCQIVSLYLINIFGKNHHSKFIHSILMGRTQSWFSDNFKLSDSWLSNNLKHLLWLFALIIIKQFAAGSDDIGN